MQRMMMMIDESMTNNEDKSKLQPSIPLTVSVSENGLCLEFGVRAFRDEISVNSLSLNKEENSEDQLAYEGPEFSDSDENLQKAFHKYLEIRGLKPNTANEFGVRAFRDEISVNSLSLNKEENSEDQLAYEGSEFSDLDENLQKVFHKYLEIRGLKPSKANFLLEYMICKDSEEYLQWLKNLKKFVQS